MVQNTQQLAFDFDAPEPAPIAEDCEFCPTCQAKLTGRWEKLTPGLCKSLVKFYQTSVAKQKYVLHLQEDCNFTKNEFTNWQKLQYFNLVERFVESGYWQISKLGKEFLQGKAVVQKVYVFRNRVERFGDEFITISQALKSDPYWMKKEDFK